jgi:hypothetical protein
MRNKYLKRMIKNAQSEGKKYGKYQILKNAELS